MIGISYYPKWSTNSLGGLGRTINMLRNRYPKVEITVVETAYPWTTGQNSALAKDNVTPGYPATPQGQKDFLIDLTQTVISNGGVGVLLWAPEWIPSQCTKGSVRDVDWEVMTFFGPNGEVLPGIDFMRHEYDRPVNVTFRFRGVKAKPRQTFYLWGDFFGDPDFLTFPVRREAGALVYRTTVDAGDHYSLPVVRREDDDEAAALRLEVERRRGSGNRPRSRYGLRIRCEKPCTLEGRT